jgi:hypothetical protein
MTAALAVVLDAPEPTESELLDRAVQDAESELARVRAEHRERQAELERATAVQSEHDRAASEAALAFDASGASEDRERLVTARRSATDARVDLERAQRLTARAAEPLAPAPAAVTAAERKRLEYLTSAETHFIPIESSKLRSALDGGCYRCAGDTVETVLIYIDEVDDSVEALRAFCNPCLGLLLSATP